MDTNSAIALDICARTVATPLAKSEHSIVEPDRLWITWNEQVRNIGLAAAFRSRLVTLDFERHGPLLRYLACTALTIWHVLSHRYKYVFAQCPSVVCTALLGLLKPLGRYKLVIDAHNATFEYPQASRVLRFLVRYSFNRANFVIVSNDSLTADVQQLGSVPLVLPDSLPKLGSHSLPPRFQQGQQHTITFICSFMRDEPVDVFLSSVRHLPHGFRVFVTGDSSRAAVFRKFESDVIVFTGYLPRQEFEGLIQHSDLLVDLTTRSDCLVCGAYEALAAGVPAILSNHTTLREMFPRGFLFADDNVDSYRQCIRSYFENPQPYRRGIQLAKAAFVERWNEHFCRASRNLFERNEEHDRHLEL